MEVTSSRGSEKKEVTKKRTKKERK